jgi:hypothetical protein
MTDVQRRARRVGLQTAALLVLLLSVVALVTWATYERAEHEDARRSLRAATEDPHLSDMPPGFWALQVSGRRSALSGFAPAGLPLQEDLARVLADGRPRQREVRLPSGTWLVRTSPRAGGVVQVALDRSDAEETSARVGRSLLVSSAVGVLLAGGITVLLTRRALTPSRRFSAGGDGSSPTPATSSGHV